MAYTNAKIYFDGSHYIAIPKEHFSRVQKPSEQQYEPHKAEFNKAYSESKSLPKKERKEFITNSLKDIFENEWQAEEYVQKQLNRVATNRIKRKVRLMRKVNLQEWTHFCTFTYNDKIHTEDSFKEKLRNTLKHLVSRRGWKYIGAWERSPDKQRLHFHGIFYIPSMIGTLQEVTDYSTKTHRRQITHQNTHFLKHFGRNDFKNICTLEYIVDQLLELQERKIQENTVLKMLVKEQRQTENSINNIMSAIENGGTSNTVMKRLRELENQNEELEKQIRIERAKTACRISKEEIERYYKTALQQEPQMLINYLVKEMLLFDDKMEIIYNTPRTLSLDESQGFLLYDGNSKMQMYETNGVCKGKTDFRLVMKF